MRFLRLVIHRNPFCSPKCRGCTAGWRARWVDLVAVMLLLGSSDAAQATDYFRQNAPTGPFTTSNLWLPYNPVPPNLILGPGGAGDTVNFDVGVIPALRYTVSGVSGQNDRLLVHNDALTLNFAGNYTVLSPSSGVPGFSAGVANGDNGDVTFTGTGVLQAEFSAIGPIAGSSGVVTVDSTGFTWNNAEDLTVGGGGVGTLNVLAGEVVVGGSLLANAQSSIQLDGGKLTVHEFGAGAFDALNWQSGTLRLTDRSALTIGTGGLFGASLLVDQNKALEVNASPFINGNAMLKIEGGGSFSSGFAEANPAIIGGDFGGSSNPESIGVVTVDGEGSSWTVGNQLHVGLQAQGRLSIEAGGSVSSTWAIISSNAFGVSGADGSVQVTGAGSEWTIT